MAWRATIRATFEPSPVHAVVNTLQTTNASIEQRRVMHVVEHRYLGNSSVVPQPQQVKLMVATLSHLGTHTVHLRMRSMEQVCSLVFASYVMPTSSSGPP